MLSILRVLSEDVPPRLVETCRMNTDLTSVLGNMLCAVAGLYRKMFMD
jgi:hypothetical protein